jgi:restriction system protein
MNVTDECQIFPPYFARTRELGGSSALSVLNTVDSKYRKRSSEEELEKKLRNGMDRIDNQISWSKIYLARSGLLDVSDPDVLSLTEEGISRELNEKDVLLIFKKIHSGFVTKKVKEKAEKHVDLEKTAEKQPYTVELLELLRSLPPQGFERLCQRLLRSSGFKKVIVSGRSGDGGIDGEGILEINPLVSVKVIFQCKRYKDAISASHIRDFRGAMQGRAEKGIFITTGRFTNEAKAEAVREGTPPIELVDGDKLVVLFEQGQLGLMRKVTYEVDDSFFDEYR